jgi:hypothetical protein
MVHTFAFFFLVHHVYFRSALDPGWILFAETVLRKCLPDKLQVSEYTQLPHLQPWLGRFLGSARLYGLLTSSACLALLLIIYKIHCDIV